MATPTFEELPYNIKAVFRGGEMEPGESITSPVHRIHGLPWCWRVTRSAKPKDNFYRLFLISEAAQEYELYHFCAIFQMNTVHPVSFEEIRKGNYRTFSSWKAGDHIEELIFQRVPVGKTVEYKMVVVCNVVHPKYFRFTRRPSAIDLLAVPDVLLVVEGRKFPVNKQMLAAQSSYFNILFFGSFKETKEKEIELKGINPEIFHELLQILFGKSIEPTTEESAANLLSIADMLDFKIVCDRVENFLLATELLSYSDKMSFAHEFRLETLQVYCPKPK